MMTRRRAIGPPQAGGLHQFAQNLRSLTTKREPIRRGATTQACDQPHGKSQDRPETVPRRALPIAPETSGVTEGARAANRGRPTS